MNEQQLCKDFLRMKKGLEVEAIQASIMMRDQWGIRIDWHEFSTALEYLVFSKEATRTGLTGERLVTYIVE